MTKRPLATLCAMAVFLCVALLSGSCSGTGEVLDSSGGQGHLQIQMIVSGLDWNVYVDGAYVGRLTVSGQRIERDYPEGSHSLTLRDNPTGRESYPYTFTVVTGATRILQLGSGDTPIAWR
ncbi:MAG: hypothetical protein LAO51_14350 [Acidobacteriia bacterium]|nr:hypothetical protein [Terriglobia bacterium]